LLRSYWIRFRLAEYGFPRITLLGSSVNRGKLRQDEADILLAGANDAIADLQALIDAQATAA
jgi:hypothetical protein